MHRPGPAKPITNLFNLLLIALFFSCTLHGASVLNFPRLSWEDGTYTGVAIANPTNATATVTLTAYGQDGKLLAGPGITNPKTITIGPGEQLAQTTYELFGSGLDTSTVGWFQATSPTDDLTGFFLFLNGKVTFFDGADLPVSSSRITFNEIRLQDPFSTELNLINPGNWEAEMTLNLVGGHLPVSKPLTIPPAGAARLDVSTFFEVTNYPEPAYVTVTSDVDVAGFAFVRGSGDLLGSNARPATEQLNTLFFPQVAILDPYKSELAILNYGDDPAILTITVYQGNGQLYGSENLQQNPVTRAINGGEILREDLEEMFGFQGEDLLDGWLKVESTSALVNGSLTYAIPSLKSLAAVSTEAQGRRTALFSHIATTLGYYTGVAVLNAGSLAANLRVVAMEADGTLLGIYTSTLQPGERMSKLITDLIPQSANQNGGMIWVSSDLPVYMTGLFVNIKNGVLANIAPQPVTDAFRPDQGEPVVTVSPGLAILPPAQSQNFTVAGASGPVQWSVNGVLGGTAATGTITSTGRYSAPASVPQTLPVTVTARTGDQLVGASVDVLSQQVLVGGLGLVQSIAYLSGLQKLYVAELRLTASGTTEKLPMGTDTTILDVTGAPQTVLNIPGEEVSKMIPFRAKDDKEYLLLASKSSGRIIRLNPTSKQTQTVAGNLDGPQAIVIDPVTGDLLVAEANQVTTVPRSQLDQGLTGSAELLETKRSRVNPKQVRFNAASSGIAVDRCNGNIYLSDPEQGAIQVYDRVSGQLKVLVTGLVNPGQMQGFNRSGLSCPASFHMLVVEAGEIDRLSLVIPDGKQVLPWLDSPGIRDVTFLPDGNPFFPGSGVALAGAPDSSGMVDLTPMPGLYQQQTVNPPVLAGPGFQGPCTITQITHLENPSFAWIPDISANGNRIAFLSNGDFTEENANGLEQVFLYSRDTMSFQQVTPTTPTHGLLPYPEVDGDGSHVVFDATVDLTGAGPGVHLYHTESRTLQLLVPIEGQDSLWDASIDDAGLQVVFTSYEDLAGLNPKKRSQVFSVFSDFPQEIFQYTQADEGSWRRAEVSGDGSSFGSLFFDNLFLDVYLNFTRVGTMQDDQPPDSPTRYTLYQVRPNFNGTRLAFNSRENLTGQNPDRGREIFLFDSGSGATTQITQSPDRNSGQIAISGSGDLIVIASNADLTGGNPDGNSELFLYNASNGTFIQLTNTLVGWNAHPAMSGDGGWIAFHSAANLTGENPDLSSEIYLADCTEVGQEF